MNAAKATAPRVRFDRHELDGAFGDIRTDLPLLVALIATCHLEAAQRRRSVGPIGITFA